MTDEKLDNLILETLDDSKYKARTIRGIAKVTRTSDNIIRVRLKTSSTLKSKVKIFPKKSKDGKILITTRENFAKKASLTDKFIDAFATKRVSI